MPGILLVISALLLATGCARDTVLAAEDYDQSCKTAGDCVAVLVGDVCACKCEWGAIAGSAQTIFQADESTAREACGSEINLCGPCPDSPALACDSGKCSIAK